MAQNVTIDINAKYEQFERALDVLTAKVESTAVKMDKAFSGSGKEIKNTTNAVNDLHLGLKNISVIAAGELLANGFEKATASIKKVGKQIYDTTSYMQGLEMSMNSIVSRDAFKSGKYSSYSEAIQNAEKDTEELMAWFKKLSLVSPYEYTDVIEAFKQNANMGQSVETAKKTTKAILELGSGLGMVKSQMSGFSIALAQTGATGKISAQDIRQFANNGFGMDKMREVFDIIGKKYDIVIEDHNAFNNAVKEGKITTEDFFNALSEYADTNFGGSVERMAGTIGGLISSMKDIKTNAINDLFLETSKTISKTLKPYVEYLMELLTSGNFTKWGKDLNNWAQKALTPIQKIGATLESGDMRRGINNLRDFLNGKTVNTSAFRYLLEEINGKEFADEWIGRLDKIKGYIDKFIANKDTLIGALKGIGIAFATAFAVNKVKGLIEAIAHINPSLLALTAIGAAVGVAWEKNLWGIQDRVKGFVESAKTYIGSLKTVYEEKGMSGVWDKLKTDGEFAISQIPAKFDEALSKIGEYISTHKDGWIASIKEGAYNVVEAVFGPDAEQELQTFVETTVPAKIELYRQAWETNGISGVWSQFAIDADTALDEITGFIDTHKEEWNSRALNLVETLFGANAAEDVRVLFEETIPGAINTLQTKFEPIKAIFEETFSETKNNVINDFKRTIENIEGILSKDTWENFKKTAALIGIVLSAMADITLGGLDNSLKFVETTLTNVLSIADSLLETFGSIFDYVSGEGDADAIGESARKLGERIVVAIEDLLWSVAEIVMGIAFDVGDWLTGIGIGNKETLAYNREKWNKTITNKDEYMQDRRMYGIAPASEGRDILDIYKESDYTILTALKEFEKNSNEHLPYGSVNEKTYDYLLDKLGDTLTDYEKEQLINYKYFRDNNGSEVFNDFMNFMTNPNSIAMLNSSQSDMHEAIKRSALWGYSRNQNGLDNAMVTFDDFLEVTGYSLGKDAEDALFNKALPVLENEYTKFMEQFTSYANPFDSRYSNLIDADKTVELMSKKSVADWDLLDFAEIYTGQLQPIMMMAADHMELIAKSTKEVTEATEQANSTLESAAEATNEYSENTKNAQENVKLFTDIYNGTYTESLDAAQEAVETCMEETETAVTESMPKIMTHLKRGTEEAEKAVKPIAKMMATAADEIEEERKPIVKMMANTLKEVADELQTEVIDGTLKSVRSGTDGYATAVAETTVQIEEAVTETESAGLRIKSHVKRAAEEAEEEVRKSIPRMKAAANEVAETAVKTISGVKSNTAIMSGPDTLYKASVEILKNLPQNMSEVITKANPADLTDNYNYLNALLSDAKRNRNSYSENDVAGLKAAVMSTLQTSGWGDIVNPYMDFFNGESTANDIDLAIDALNGLTTAMYEARENIAKEAAGIATTVGQKGDWNMFSNFAYERLQALESSYKTQIHTVMVEGGFNPADFSQVDSDKEIRKKYNDAYSKAVTELLKQGGEFAEKYKELFGGLNEQTGLYQGGTYGQGSPLANVMGERSNEIYTMLGEKLDSLREVTIENFGDASKFLSNESLWQDFAETVRFMGSRMDETDLENQLINMAEKISGDPEWAQALRTDIDSQLASMSTSAEKVAFLQNIVAGIDSTVDQLKENNAKGFAAVESAVKGQTTTSTENKGMLTMNEIVSNWDKAKKNGNAQDMKMYEIMLDSAIGSLYYDDNDDTYSGFLGTLKNMNGGKIPTAVDILNEGVGGDSWNLLKGIASNGFFSENFFQENFEQQYALYLKQVEDQLKLQEQVKESIANLAGGTGITGEGEEGGGTTPGGLLGLLFGNPEMYAGLSEALTPEVLTAIQSLLTTELDAETWGLFAQSLTTIASGFTTMAQALSGGEEGTALSVLMDNTLTSAQGLEEFFSGTLTDSITNLTNALAQTSTDENGEVTAGGGNTLYTAMGVIKGLFEDIKVVSEKMVNYWNGELYNAVIKLQMETTPIAVRSLQKIKKSVSSLGDAIFNVITLLGEMIGLLEGMDGVTVPTVGGGTSNSDTGSTGSKKPTKSKATGGVDRLAGGGGLFPYGTAIVGEHGPEIIRTGSSRLNVFANTQLMDEIAHTRHALNMLSNSAEAVYTNRMLGGGMNTSNTDNSQHFENHFGAVIGDKAFRDMVENTVRDVWRREMRLAS